MDRCMAWNEWMVVNLSVEESLNLENQARVPLRHDNAEEVAALCSTLIKQNHHLTKLLKQAVGRIAELETTIYLTESNRRSWWKRI